MGLVISMALGVAGGSLAGEPADPDHRPAYVLDVNGDETLTLACGLTVPKIKDARGFPHGGLGLRRSHPCDGDRCDALDLWRADQFVAAWRDPGTNVVTLLRLSYPFPYALQPGQLLPADRYYRDARALAAAGYPAVTPEQVQDWLHFYYQSGSTGAVPLEAASSFRRLDTIEEGERYDVESGGRQRQVYVFKLRDDAKTPHPLDLWFALEIRSERRPGSKEEAFAEAFFKTLGVDPGALVSEREYWATEPFDTFARANAVRGVRNLGGEWQAFHHGPYCLVTDNPAALPCAEEGLEAQQRAYDLFPQVLFPFGPASLDAVCVIRVYATGWEFEDSVPRTRKWAGGMYMPGSDEIVMRGWSDGGTVHEITHRYLRVACGKRGLSVWFNEGLACYLGGCQVSGGRLVPPPVDAGCMLLAMLEQGESRVIAEVFTVEDFYLDKEMERNPKDPVAALKRAKNYAAAWGVIYFLREASALYPGKGYEAVIPLYWETLLKTGDPERATEAVLRGINLPRFLEDLKEYFQTHAEASGNGGENRRSKRRLVTDDEHGEFLPRERRLDFAALMFGDDAYVLGGASVGRTTAKRKVRDRMTAKGGAAKGQTGADGDGGTAPQDGDGAGWGAVAAAVFLAAGAGLAVAWGWRRFGGGRLSVFVLVFSAGAAAGEVAETNGYVVTYFVVGEVAVIGTGEGCAVEPKPEGVFTVPPTLGGHPVAAVGAYAFAECEELTELKLPKTVTAIGACAFHSCRKLNSISLPDSVTDLGDGVFFLCSSLERAALPPHLAAVPAWTFGRCFRLSSVTFGDAVRMIGHDAFLGCASLAAVELPESVVEVGERAFKWCSGLRSAAFKGAVEVIREEVFAGCAILGEVSLPQTVTVIGEGAFRWCAALRHVTIPERVKGIGDYAFYGCRTLSALDIPDEVAEVGRYAFSGCLNLERADLGDGLTRLGDHAFYECSSLSSLLFPASLTVIHEAAFARCAGLFSLTLPPGLATLEKEVFRECAGLVSVTLPPGMKAVGDAAFEKCANLSSITLPDSVAAVGSSAFGGCERLRDVDLGVSVARIGKGAFSGCESLGDLEVPASVRSLGGGVFEGCVRLTVVRFLGDAPSAGTDVYAGTPERLVSYVLSGAKGWPSAKAGQWKDRPLIYETAPP